MISQTDERAVLLCHDGELDDLRPLIEGLEAGLVERQGALCPADRRGSWDLVVATPARLLEIGPRPDGAVPERIAILDQPTRTLMAMLERAGVELWVRRPFHPAALRLLLLHSLFRGHEKRKRRRVTVGARVHFRARLRRRAALLADLSTRGCRLLTRHSARHRAAITLILPGAICGGRSFQLTGRVVRTGPASGGEAGTQAIAIVFDPLSKHQALRLKRVVDQHVRGPAVLPKAPGEKQAPARAVGRHDSEPETDVHSEPSGVESAADRRTEPRVAYQSRVIALDEEAARVLIGRDLSVGGMRVEPHAGLQTGDTLRIALHIGALAEPLVVEARVERDEGDGGLALQFRNLDTLAREHIHKMVRELPLQSEDGQLEADPGVVVSEILEGRSASGRDPDQHTEE